MGFCVWDFLSSSTRFVCCSTDWCLHSPLRSSHSAVQKVDILQSCGLISADLPLIGCSPAFFFFLLSYYCFLSFPCLLPPCYPSLQPFLSCLLLCFCPFFVFVPSGPHLSDERSQSSFGYSMTGTQNSSAASESFVAEMLQHV